MGYGLLLLLQLLLQLQLLTGQFCSNWRLASYAPVERSRAEPSQIVRTASLKNGFGQLLVVVKVGQGSQVYGVGRGTSMTLGVSLLPPRLPFLLCTVALMLLLALQPRRARDATEALPRLARLLSDRVK